MRKISNILIFWACWVLLFPMAETGCKRDRIFVKLDSPSRVPSQFRFFNSFTYDDALSLSIDGLLRETVTKGTVSKYYPSINRFNQTEVANTKAISIFDPLNNVKFSDTSFFRFAPNTGYLAFPVSPSYRVTGQLTSKDRKRPTTIVVNEEILQPYDGYCRWRVLNATAGTSMGPTDPLKSSVLLPLSMTITPDIGGASRNTLGTGRGYTASAINNVSYALTLPGKKTISISSQNTVLTFKPFEFKEGINYTFIATGDFVNYFLNLEPAPKLYVLEGGNANPPLEVPLQSLSRNTDDSRVKVRVIDDAFNLPDTIGRPFTGRVGINVVFNDQKLSLDGANQLAVLSYGVVNISDVGIEAITNAINPAQHTRSIIFNPQVASISVRTNATTAPFFNIRPFNFSFESGLSYSIFLSPRVQPERMTDLVIATDDIDVIPSKCKLRVANVLLGGGSLDLRRDGESGPIVIENIAFGTVIDYTLLDADPSQQRFVFTRSGSSINVFNVEQLLPGKNADNYFQIPLLGGNNGTLVVGGSVVPTYNPNGQLPRAARPNEFYYLPSIQFLQDAYFNDQSQIITGVFRGFPLDYNIQN